MKLQAESTDQILYVNGIPARVWNATTESGIECTLIVIRVAVLKDCDTSEFDRELKECAPPRAEALEAFPARMVL